MKLEAALEDLIKFPIALRRNRLATPVDCERELRAFSEAVSRLREPKQSSVRFDPEELLSLRERARRSGFALEPFNRRELRVLCRDRETLSNPTFVDNLYSLVTKGNFRPNVQLLVDEYFQAWRVMVRPETWEALIRHILAGMVIRGELFNRYHHSAKRLFSENGARFLAEIAEQDGRGLSEILVEWNVASGSRLASTVQDWLIRWRFDQFQDAAKPGNLLVVPRLRTLLSDMGQTGVNPALLAEMIGRLILSLAVDRDDRLRKLVEDFVLKDSRLGDPRLPQNRPHWAVIDPAAERRFHAWRARMDLLFFFDSVLRDGHDRNGRKHFWMQYIAQVEDSVVALCAAHRFELAQDLRRHGIYCPSIKENDGNSCFIMRFRLGNETITAVEFSKVGSVRVFSEQAFKKCVGDFRKAEFRIAELKVPDDTPGVLAIRHYTSWQQKLSTELARWGLRPR